MRLDAVLEAVQLPAGIADLDPGLANVNADYLSHRSSSRETLAAGSGSGGRREQAEERDGMDAACHGWGAGYLIQRVNRIQ